MVVKEKLIGTLAPSTSAKLRSRKVVSIAVEEKIRMTVMPGLVASGIMSAEVAVGTVAVPNTACRLFLFEAQFHPLSLNVNFKALAGRVKLIPALTTVSATWKSAYSNET